MNWGNWSSAEKRELRPITTVVTTSWVPSEHAGQLDHEWAGTWRGGPEWLQYIYFWQKHFNKLKHHRRIARLHSETSLWLGMWNLNALQWRWSIEKSCRTWSQNLQEASMRWQHSICVPPALHCALATLRHVEASTGSGLCHWFVCMSHRTMVHGDNGVASCVSVLEQEGWGWTHLF